MTKGFWRNWRLRTQICLIQSVLTTLIIILAMICTYGFLQYATDVQVHTSEQVFQKQFGKQAKIIMSYHIKSVSYTLYRSKQQIMKTNALYHLMQQIQYPIIEQPYSCLNNLSLVDEYAYSASFCYEIYVDSEPSMKIQYLKNLCSFLTGMFLMIDGDYDLMFASTGDQHFFSVWPGSFLGPTYNPQLRIWYTNHLDQLSKNMDNQTFFSPPHIHYTWKLLMIAQTLSMTDLNGQLNGVIASHVNLSQFKQSSEDITFQIIYPDGRILLSQYNITENSYIYDTNLTNLNYSDYVQIINQANKKTTNSTCDTGLWDDFGYLCLKVNNSNDKQELFNAYSIEQAGLILIIQIKLSQFHIQLEDMFTEFQQIIYQLYIGTFIGFLGYMITSVVLSSIVIMLLFNPLIRIINYTSQEIFKENFSRQYILKQKTKFRYNKIQSQEATTMENLQQSFNKMIHTISNKSELCFLLEHFIYPRKRWRMKKRAKKINKNNLQLINNQYEIGDKLTDYQIRFIQSLFRQNHLE